MKKKIYYRIKNLALKTSETWDKLSPIEKDAITFAHTYINPEPTQGTTPPFSPEYRLAASGETINQEYLRKGTIIPAISDIIDTLSKNTTQTDIVVYRGICYDIFNQMLDNAIDKPTTDLIEKGVLQTSLVKGHELPADIYLRIFVPSGTKALYLGNVNQEQHLYEVDIMTGAHLSIVSADSKYLNCILQSTN